MNTVNLLGRFVAPAVPRGTGEHLAAAFTLAVDRDYKTPDGVRPVDFIDCVAFGSCGSFVLSNFHKGQRAAVVGSLRIDTYTAADGSSRRAAAVRVDNIYFAD